MVSIPDDTLLIAHLTGFSGNEATACSCLHTKMYAIALASANSESVGKLAGELQPLLNSPICG